MIQKMLDVLECAKQCRQRAQEKSKFNNNKKRCLREFEVGQKVFCESYT